MAQRIDGLAAIDALLPRKPLEGHVPNPMIPGVWFNLAHAILVAVASFRPPRARTQSDLALIEELAEDGTEGCDPHRSGLPSLGACNQYQAVVSPSLGCGFQAANHNPSLLAPPQRRPPVTFRRQRQNRSIFRPDGRCVETTGASRGLQASPLPCKKDSSLPRSNLGLRQSPRAVPFSLPAASAAHSPGKVCSSSATSLRLGAFESQ